MTESDPDADHRETVRRLANEYARGLILYARQWFDSAAEDVVQEAFLKLLTETVLPESPKAWLYRVVRNGALDRQRRERFRRSSPMDNWFESLPEKSSSEEPTFDGEALTRALESLMPEWREIVVSKIWGDLNFREIAELTGRPISSVHLDYQRALDRLRTLLQEESNE